MILAIKTHREMRMNLITTKKEIVKTISIDTNKTLQLYLFIRLL